MVETSKNTNKFYEDFSKLHDDFSLYWKDVTVPDGYTCRTRFENVIFTIKKLVKKGDKIIDVGCGDGIYLSNLPTNVKKFGFDISKIYIERAKQKNSKAQFKLGQPNCDLPYKNGEFDVVYSSEVIEHIEDLQLFLNEIVRITKSGGTIILTTPSKYGFRPGSLIYKYNFIAHFNKLIDYFIMLIARLFKTKKSKKISPTADWHLHIFSKRDLLKRLNKAKLIQYKTCALYLPFMALISKLFRFKVRLKSYRKLDNFIGHIPVIKNINHTMILVFKKL
ncbi:class I SAM-dependent methyltransferase [Nanoarchaeota archaeon]